MKSAEQVSQAFREMAERMRAESEAWKTLRVSETAPTPERQAALNRALHEAKLILRAARTLADENAPAESVELAGRIVDAVWAPLSPGDHEHPPSTSATNHLIDLLEKAGGDRTLTQSEAELRAVAVLNSFAAFWPDVAQRIDHGQLAGALLACAGRSKTQRKWDSVIALLKAAGLPSHSEASITKQRERWRGSLTTRLLGR